MEVVPASSGIPVADPIRSGGPWRIISGGLSPTCRNGPGLSCLFQAIGRNGILPFMSASDRVSISTTIIFRHILTSCAGKIGRASCRERVSVRVDLGGLRIITKKKKQTKKQEQTNQKENITN